MNKRSLIMEKEAARVPSCIFYVFLLFLIFYLNFYLFNILSPFSSDFSSVAFESHWLTLSTVRGRGGSGTSGCFSMLIAQVSFGSDWMMGSCWCWTTWDDVPKARARLVRQLPSQIWI
jgi:hypothetical protein